MAAFNLTAQLQLQAPTNIPQVVSAIRKQLEPIGIKVNIGSSASALAQVNKQLQGTTRSAGELNRTLQESARRFSVITLATGTLLGFVAAVKNSVRSAIDFEKSLVNLSQVTGKTTDQLKPLSDEVTRLATTLGTSSKDLIDAAQTLAQAGFSAEKTKQALDILAKTTLASSFGKITDTTEGAIAALAQFSDLSASTATQIQFLESTLNSINSVSKAFAVESSDLITVIRRTGGVFAAAGGSVEELIALFTSVRATTRESAETIATGLRTIFTRIQRPETIDLLKNLGIQLQDAEGKFVGAYEAVKRLAEGLSALDPRDVRFAGIIEELGGFRQVGKVIPLLKQFAVAQDALNVAQAASGSVAEDARIAQQSLANQIIKLREEFDALIRKFTASETFRSIAGGALELAKAFIKVADSLEPLLPLITSLFALKIGSGLAPGVASLVGIGGGRTGGGAGRVSRFARGGVVPGSGSGDTVPAMLTPGEFVIRKSSVKKLGANTLHAMNQNRHAAGGVIKQNTLGMAIPDTISSGPGYPTIKGSATLKIDSVKGEEGPLNKKTGFGKLNSSSIIDLFSGQGNKSIREGKIPMKDLVAIAKKVAGFNVKTYQTISEGVTGEDATDFNAIVDTELKGAIKNGAKQWASKQGVKLSDNQLQFSKNFELPAGFKGTYFESVLDAFQGRPIGAEASDSRRPFDFVSGLKPIGGLFNNLASQGVQYVDAKVSGGSNISQQEYTKKLVNQAADDFANDSTFLSLIQQRNNELKQNLEKKASGGSISGTDTIPALLTPGEFVVNKKTASRVGYGNLNRMNKTGVAHFAKGGIAGVQKFAGGGGPTMSAVKPLMGASAFNYGMAFGPLDVKDDLKKLSDVFKTVGVDSKSANRALKQIVDQIKAGVSPAEAYNKALRDLQDSYDKNKKNTEAAKKSQQTTQGLQGVQGSLQNFQSLMGTLQSFVFLGATVASVTSQMSGLSDSTKEAINQTSAFAASMVGIIGTLANTVSSFADSLISQALATAKSQEISATMMSTEAELEEAAASKEAAMADLQSSKAASVGLTSLTAGLAVAVVGMSYFQYQQSKAASAAQEAGKAFEDAMNRLGSDGDVAGATRLKTEQIAKTYESNANDAAKWGFGIGAAVASVVTALLLFLATLAGITGIGLPLAGLFTVLAAATGGVVVALSEYQKSMVGVDDVLANFSTTTSNLIQTISNLSKAAYQFEEAIKNIEQNKLLSEKEKTQGKIAATEQLIPSIRPNIPVSGSEPPITAQKQSLDIVTSIARQKNVSIESLRSEEGRKSAGLSPAQAGTVELQFRQLESYLKNLNTAISNTRDTFYKVTENELGFNDIRDVLKDNTTLIGKAYQQYVEAIKLETESRIESAKQESQNAKDLEKGKKSVYVRKLATKMASGSTAAKAEEDPEVKAAKKEYNDSIANRVRSEEKVTEEQERGAKRLKELEESTIKANEKQKEANIARIQEYNALQKLRAEIERSQRIGAVLNDFIDSLDQAATSIDNQVSLFGGGKFKVTGPKIQEIGDVGNVQDRVKFEKQVETVGSRFGAAGKELADKLKKQSAAYDKAIKGLQTAPRFVQEDNVNKEAEKILQQAGIEQGAAGSKEREIYDMIFEQVKKQLSTGGQVRITREDAQKILDPLKNVMDEDAKRLQQFQEIYSKELENYSKYVNALDEYRSKELEGLSNIYSTIEKAVNIRARARGKETEVSGLKETIRTQAAQARLNQAGAGIGGAGAAAGNLASLAKARRTSMTKLEETGKQIDIYNQGGGPEEGVARQRKIEALIDAESKQRSIIEATNKELERLADQSEKVADIQSEIEKEQRKRGQIKDFVKSFVVAGQEERSSTLNAIQGLNQAYMQGTLQGLDEDMRKSVVGLLDSLSDVNIPGGGGATGKQILDEFVLRDAVRMGFPPDWVRALTGATSKEEKLIKSIDQLTMQMIDAAKIRAEMPNKPIFTRTINTDKLNIAAKPEEVAQRAAEGKAKSEAEPYKPPTEEIKAAMDASKISAEEIKNAMSEASKSAEEMVRIIREENNRLTREGYERGTAEGMAPGWAVGGHVLNSKSVSNKNTIFKPKGTDTVPAMLTPGEFVVRKSAVDKIGANTLQAINQGKDVVGYSKGGPVLYAKDGVEVTPRQRSEDDWRKKVEKRTEEILKRDYPDMYPLLEKGVRPGHEERYKQAQQRAIKEIEMPRNIKPSTQWNKGIEVPLMSNGQLMQRIVKDEKGNYKKDERGNYIYEDMPFDEYKQEQYKNAEQNSLNREKENQYNQQQSNVESKRQNAQAAAQAVLATTSTKENESVFDPLTLNVKNSEYLFSNQERKNAGETLSAYDKDTEVNDARAAMIAKNEEEQKNIREFKAQSLGYGSAQERESAKRKQNTEMAEKLGKYKAGDSVNVFDNKDFLDVRTKYSNFVKSKASSTDPSFGDVKNYDQILEDFTTPGAIAKQETLEKYKYTPYYGAYKEEDDINKEITKNSEEYKKFLASWQSTYDRESKAVEQNKRSSPRSAGGTQGPVAEPDLLATWERNLKPLEEQKSRTQRYYEKILGELNNKKNTIVNSSRKQEADLFLSMRSKYSNLVEASKDFHTQKEERSLAQNSERKFATQKEIVDKNKQSKIGSIDEQIAQAEKELTEAEKLDEGSRFKNYTAKAQAKLDNLKSQKNQTSQQNPENAPEESWLGPIKGINSSTNLLKETYDRSIRDIEHDNSNIFGFIKARTIKNGKESLTEKIDLGAGLEFKVGDFSASGDIIDILNSKPFIATIPNSVRENILNYQNNKSDIQKLIDSSAIAATDQKMDYTWTPLDAANDSIKSLSTNFLKTDTPIDLPSILSNYSSDRLRRIEAIKELNFLKGLLELKQQNFNIMSSALSRRVTDIIWGNLGDEGIGSNVFGTLPNVIQDKQKEFYIKYLREKYKANVSNAKEASEYYTSLSNDDQNKITKDVDDIYKEWEKNAFNDAFKQPEPTPTSTPEINDTKKIINQSKLDKVKSYGSSLDEKFQQLYDSSLFISSPFFTGGTQLVPFQYQELSSVPIIPQTVSSIFRLYGEESPGGINKSLQDLTIEDNIPTNNKKQLFDDLNYKTSKAIGLDNTAQKLIDNINQLSQAIDPQREGKYFGSAYFPAETSQQWLGTSEEWMQRFPNLKSLNDAYILAAKSGPGPQANVEEKALGGLIYRANGGSIFKPKGTDTVPAMLTPGEFVVRKSAVDKIGVGTLQAINQGQDIGGYNQGGVVYFKKAGPVRKPGQAVPNPAQRQVQMGPNPLQQKIASMQQFNNLLPQFLADPNKYIPNFDKDQNKTISEQEMNTIFGDLTPDIIAKMQTGAVQKNSFSYKEFIDGMQKISDNGGLKPTPEEKAQAEDMRGVGVVPVEVPQSEVNIISGEQYKQIISAIAKNFAPGKIFGILTRNGIWSTDDKAAASLKIRSARTQGDASAQEAYYQIIDSLNITDETGAILDQLIATANAGFITKADIMGLQIKTPAAVSPIDINNLDPTTYEALDLGLITEEDIDNQNKSIYDNLVAQWTNLVNSFGFFKDLSTDRGNKQKALLELLDLKGIQPIETQVNNAITGIKDIYPDWTAAITDAQTLAGLGSYFDAAELLNGLSSTTNIASGIKEREKKGFVRNLSQLEMSTGGPVYRAGGGSIFKPKGTDTVPAMLTPGEFVMSAGAVNKYGVSTMNSLNRGELKGFNTGGLVGGVEYKRRGGIIGGGGGMNVTLETSELERVFDAFVSNVSPIFNNITTAMSGFTSSLDELANKFSGLQISHNVNVEGLITIGGLNVDNIANEITQSVANLVTNEVKRQLDDPSRGQRANGP